jgi:hypothetical protein
MNYQELNPPAREGSVVMSLARKTEGRESSRARHRDLRRRRLHARDVSGLEPFRALSKFELDGFALIQTPISAFLDSREMHKYIFARRALNETITLGSVEPFDCSFFLHTLLLSHVLPEISPCLAEVPSATLRHDRKTSPRCRETGLPLSSQL